MYTLARFITFIAVLAAAASPYSAAVSSRQPEGILKCLPPNSTSATLPGFEPSTVSTVERFDLEYSKPKDSLLEITFSSKSTRGKLVFVGTNHISSPDPELFGHLEGLVKRTSPSEVYLEVSDVSYLNQLPTDKETVIRTRGEPSYLGFIARQNGIEVRPLELDQISLFSQATKHFKPEHVAISHVLRDVQIARDRNRLFGENLERVASQSLSDQRKLLPIRAQATFPKNIFELTVHVSSLWPGLDWRLVPAEWSNPLLDSKATGSRFVNSIFAEEKRIRDQHMLALLLDRVASGKSVVALAGRSHAESLLVTLNCLMANG